MNQSSRGDSFSQKWGEDPFTLRGHTQIPNALIEYAARLGLRSEECWLICCILRFKYNADAPYPSQDKLAALFGQSIDTVQRTVKKIVAKKLLNLERIRSHRGVFTHAVYDFTPLRFALNECYYQDHPQERPQPPQASEHARPQKCGPDHTADLRPGQIETPGRRNASRTTPHFCGPNKNLLSEEYTQENSSSKKRGPEPPPAQPVEVSAAASLVEELVANDLNHSAALRLARERPDECRRQLEYLPHVAEFTSSRGAYLRSAIEQGFGPPKGYAHAQEREAQEARRAEAARAREAAQQQEEDRQAVILAARARLERDPVVWARIQAEAEAKLPVPLRGKPGHVAYKPALEALINEIVAGIALGGV